MCIHVDRYKRMAQKMNVHGQRVSCFSMYGLEPGRCNRHDSCIPTLKEAAAGERRRLLHKGCSCKVDLRWIRVGHRVNTGKLTRVYKWHAFQGKGINWSVDRSCLLYVDVECTKLKI